MKHNKWNYDMNSVPYGGSNGPIAHQYIRNNDGEIIVMIDPNPGTVGPD